MSNLSELLAYLEGPALGLSPDQAAGVAGNLVVESGLSPTIVNKKEGALGLAQWENGRLTQLQQFAAQNGTAPDDFQTQLQFLGNELHGSESGALAHLQATSDPASAAAAFDQYYERSAGTSRAQRIDNARKIAAGQDPSGGASSPGATGSSSATASSAGFLSIGGWQGSVLAIGLKVLGAGAAAALVIVGATHTVSN